MRYSKLAIGALGVLLFACDVEEASLTDEAVDLTGMCDSLGESSADPAAAGLIPLTEEPIPSVALDETWIRVWISPGAADDYLEIQPDDFGAGVSLPDGTLIVREVFDADLALTKRTLIAKEGDPGELGGWLFGVFDVEGEVMMDDNGDPQIGMLDSCAGCHLSRPDDDYLFGMPD